MPTLRPTVAPTRQVPLLERSRVVAVLVAIACFAVAAIGLRVSDPGDDFRVLKAEVGQTVSLAGGELTVDEVEVGSALSVRNEVTARTTGMFVVVRVRWANPDSAENVGVGAARLLTKDRTYLAYGSDDRVSSAPGFENTVDFQFEVDPAQIDGLTLEMWDSGVLIAYHDQARFQLGITRTNADAWRTAAKDRVLPVLASSETKALG